MQIEANVTESTTCDHVHLSAHMDREAALVLIGVFGAILGNPDGPRGVTSVLYSQLSNTLQLNSGEGLAVHADGSGEIRLVKSSTEMLRQLGQRRKTLWTNRVNPDEVAVD